MRTLPLSCFHRFPVKSSMFTFLFCISSYCLLLAPVSCTTAKNTTNINWKQMSVLVYTKNGKGYVHTNIPSAVAAMKEMGVQNGFSVDVSDDPSVFNEANLKKYNALVFT